MGESVYVAKAEYTTYHATGRLLAMVSVMNDETLEDEQGGEAQDEADGELGTARHVRVPEYKYW